MNEYDSPNFAEFSYTRKSEGAAKIARLCALFCQNSQNMKGQIFRG